MSQSRRSPRRGSAGQRVEISAVVIAKDEECHIADLAASLESVVDETVLLDTGSTDDTVPLARAHGFRVVHREWTDHFAEARNAALGYARGHWVLSIDADERLVTRHPDDLRQLVAALATLNGGNLADGFFITLDNFLTDDLDERATERFQQVRLFKRSRLHYEGRIHEQLRVAVGERSPLFLKAPATIRIAHLGYTPKIAERKEKATRNRVLVEAAVTDVQNDDADAVTSARLRFERARVEMSVAPSRGIALMLDALGDLPPDSDFHPHGTATAARFLVEAGRHDEALSLLERAVPKDGFATTLGVLRATALARSGRDAEALDVVARIEQTRDRSSSDVDLLIRVPALKAELLAISGGPRESWRTLLSLLSNPAVDAAAGATGVADRSWRLAARAGRPDRYLAELSELTSDEQFRQVLALLPEEHERAAAGTRHLLLRGPMIEPDPRLAQFSPRLAGYSVIAGLELARRRLDSEPALALGVAAEISRRADAAPAEIDAAKVLQIRALLLLNHVERAVVLASELPTELARPGSDERLRAALSRMSHELASACVIG